MTASEIYKELQEKYAGNDLKPSNTDSDLIPDNLTAEQRKRDVLTTTLYSQFVAAHSSKSSFARNSRKAIIIFCVSWISIFIIACLGLSVYVLTKEGKEASDIIALVSAIVPLVTAIIGILHVVVKYVFPEDEDKNITSIVEKIHDNDFKNKQENMKINKPELNNSGN